MTIHSIFNRLNLSILIILATTGFAFYAFITVSMFAADSKSFIGPKASWYGLTSGIFIFMTGPALVLAIHTWGTDATNKPHWKAFWNVIEVVWVVGALFGIAGLLNGGLPMFLKQADAVYTREQQELNRSLASQATALEAEYCLPKAFDDAICTALVAYKSNPVEEILTRQANAWSAFGDLLMAHRRKDPNHPAQRPLFQLHWKMFSVIENEKFRKQDLKEIQYPDWLIWLTAFAPQVFAFIFPLRLARALASFAL